MPDVHVIVVLLDHIQCGLTSSSLSSSLSSLGTNGSSWCIAISTDMCKAFLGILASLNLLLHFFALKRFVKDKLQVVCSYSLRLANKKGCEHLDVLLQDSWEAPMPDENESWRVCALVRKYWAWEFETHFHHF